MDGKVPYGNASQNVTAFISQLQAQVANLKKENLKLMLFHWGYFVSGVVVGALVAGILLALIIFVMGRVR